MGAIASSLLCLSYIVGLLLTGLPGIVWGLPLGTVGLALNCGLGALVLPRLWRRGPSWQVWLLAGAVGIVAALHLHLRTPTPAASDISHIVQQPGASAQVQMVYGFVDSAPRRTRTGKQQLVLSVFQVRAADRVADRAASEGLSDESSTALPQLVTGRLYLTAPPREAMREVQVPDDAVDGDSAESGETTDLLEAGSDDPASARQRSESMPDAVANIHPGQMVIARGFLYAPTAASNPGQFDFQAYLARRGIFTGMSAAVVQSIDGAGRFPQQLTVPRRMSRTLQSGLWQLRQRIVRSHAAGLGQPEGALISGMLLGRHAVDVPHDIRDRFASVGLAHTLAASGFHVSLLLGVMLWLTQRSSARWRLGVCLGFLLLYVGLTGVQPSVLRAALMGGAVVLATVLEQQIKPLGSLLLAALLLLVLNPLWIWELGFQLSFLATLGLLVTAPCVQRQLDWLPPAIAPLIAIPIAAYVWTLPLQMHAFGVVSVYSIGINVVTAPLVSVMTLGGAIAAAVGVLSPMVGSWVASVLYYPTHGLLLLVEWVSQLPGNGFATGTITVVQVGLLYAVYGLVWGVTRMQRHWWVMGVLCVGLVALPAWSRTQQQFQATILTTVDAPVMVVQKPGEVGLIGSLSERDADYVVLPFLRTQGINRLDWAIALQLPQTSAGWRQVLQQVSIRTLYNASTLAIDPSQPLHQDLLHKLGSRGGRSPFLPLNQAIAIGSMPVRLISLNPIVLRFQLGDLIWLMLGDRPTRDRPTPVFANVLSAAHVLWFDGRLADRAVIQTVNPRVAIASGAVPAADLQAWLRQTDIQFLAAERDGAVQWSPKVGFSRYNLADAE